MSLRADRRAQSIQIGALLLFAVLIILFATYQAFVVPNENRQIEASHADTIAQQMQELRNGIVSIPAAGEGTSVALKLGTTYPARVIAMNPSPPTGTIRTAGTDTGDVNVSVANAVGTGTELADFWDGTNRTYDSGALLYRASYREFRDSPTIVYDNSMLVHRFREGNLTRASQRLIDGNRLSLGSINGSLDKGSSGTTTVDLDAVSASDRRVSITNEAGESIFITIASQFDADHWREELQEADEFTPAGHVVSVSDDPIPGTAFKLIRIELEQDVSYTLRLSRIGVGTGAIGTDATYITAVGGRNVEQNETFTAEVRDRFNNPVSGVDVVPASSPAGCSLATKTTDDQGQVQYTCDERGTVQLEINGGTTDYERVVFGMPVLDQQDPVIDSTSPSTDTKTFKIDSGGGNGPPEGGNPNQVDMSQVTLEYTLSDQPAGLHHVTLALRDQSGSVVMNATHYLTEAQTKEGVWKTPWIEATSAEISNHDVVVRVFDRAGNTDTQVIDL